MKITCDSCFKDISHVILIQCAECDDLDLCVECFASGVELSQHKSSHLYRVLRPFDFPVYTQDWRADEELLLIEGCEQFGVGNWKDISEHIGSKDPEACESHYTSVYLNWSGAPGHNPHYLVKHTPEKPAILMPTKISPIAAKKSKKDSDVHEPTPVALQSVPANHEITGYMPGRREFETETENEAEISLKDLQFNEDDSIFDISTAQLIGFSNNFYLRLDLKLTMLDIYSGVLDRRMARKTFIFEHHLLEFKKQQTVDKMRSKEDRELFSQIKPYARFMESATFDLFLGGLVREEELRRKNQMLQEYRRHGLRTFSEVSKFEGEKKHLELYLKGGSSLSRNTLPLKEPFPLPSPTSTTSASVNSISVSAEISSTNDLRVGPAASGLRKASNPLNIMNSDGIELLSDKEKHICSILRLYPRLYLSIKDTLIREYLRTGGLKRAQARAAVKIDVNKTSRLYDFFISAGWIKAPASGE